MNNEPNPTTYQSEQAKSLKSPTSALLGILGILCLSLALLNWSKESKIRQLTKEVANVQASAGQENFEKGYLQAIWDAYFEKPRYVIDDTKSEPVLWKQVPLDQEAKDRVIAFKQEIDRQMEEGPSQN